MFKKKKCNPFYLCMFNWFQCSSVFKKSKAADGTLARENWSSGTMVLPAVEVEGRVEGWVEESAALGMANLGLDFESWLALNPMGSKWMRKLVMGLDDDEAVLWSRRERKWWGLTSW